jgi:hypothetical protein
VTAGAQKINRSALVNPESLDWFIDRPELRLGSGGKAKL